MFALLGQSTPEDTKQFHLPEQRLLLEKEAGHEYSITSHLVCGHSVDSNGFIDSPLVHSTATAMKDGVHLRDTSVHSELVIGKKIGGYMLGRTIGEGSFAKVKEAVHLQTNQRVSDCSFTACGTVFSVFYHQCHH